MLALAPPSPNVGWRLARGEALPFSDASFDTVACGSSYHWLDRERADLEILRVLRPGGFVHLYEYQFPKAQSLPELNDWIRKQFNSHWKLPNQKPRGRLREISRGLAQKGGLQLLAQERPPMLVSLSAADFIGILFSQARFLASEQLLNKLEVECRRKVISDEIQEFFSAAGSGPVEFDFALQSFIFGKSRF